MAMCRAAVGDLARGLDSVQMRHGDIHHDDIGFLRRGKLHRLPAIGRFADHFKVGLTFEQQAQVRCASPYDRRPKECEWTS